jgi:hypothetical protein
MKRFVPGALAGLAAAMLLAAPAAAAPSNVTVRIEGTTQTLVPRTAVTTSDAPVQRSGHECTGTSALGAVNAATGGDWSGSWFDGLGWFVETMKGETHASMDAGYWGLWINHTFSDLGVCSVELQAGDEVLYSPSNGPILELGNVPATVAPGQSVAAKVTRHALADLNAYPSTTLHEPAQGASVTYGTGAATTGSDGVAQLTFGGSGPVTVQATAPGSLRSAALTTCVTNGADGACGSSIPSGAVPPSTADTTAPTATLAGLRRGQVFSRKRAPKELKGTVTADPSGIKSVRLSILRKVGERCWAFDGESERFERHRCGGSKSFRIGDRAEWSYLLPRRLPRGSYMIRVAAIDNAGNDSATQTEIRVR